MANLAPKVPGWQNIFLAALRERPLIYKALEAAGIKANSTLTRERAKDPEFDQACKDAMEYAIDKIEAEGIRRAVEGAEEPVVHQGRLMYRTERYVDSEGKEQWREVIGQDGQPIPLTIRKQSDALLALMLKGRRKSVFADRTELTGPDGGPQQLEIESPTQLARKIGFVLAQGLQAAKQEAAKAKEIDDFV